MECVCKSVVRGTDNKIKLYVLEDACGNQTKMYPNTLRDKMLSGEITVINLKLECVCIDVIRGAHNKIEFYVLVNQFGVEFELYPEELKDSIKRGEITVSNLTLTKDGKLRLNK